MTALIVYIPRRMAYDGDTGGVFWYGIRGRSTNVLFHFSISNIDREFGDVDLRLALQLACKARNLQTGYRKKQFG